MRSAPRQERAGVSPLAPSVWLGLLAQPEPLADLRHEAGHGTTLRPNRRYGEQGKGGRCGDGGRPSFSSGPARCAALELACLCGRGPDGKLGDRKSHTGPATQLFAQQDTWPKPPRDSTAALSDQVAKLAAERAVLMLTPPKIGKARTRV